ncbi:transporter substrate-binding domain-containing protein [Rhizobium leguminosarum bv. viciae]|uniref:transporter substrate-binding domain-containing protein n=1 Tax=Rhizobium ruizarguesonis TaxID=2081791 RepID=UPI00103E5DAA|nr:transporter substrate-binding domain-containing protein [Rhizobium ruizarguesonis]MCB2404502.1 transporter substrate-binding domain-containing protein [Rhizobium ruizarguesonis]TBY51571.1 transporter substrate-binding domain-containing protein [Rhizobium leguminosarum bv. viciae]
MTISKIIKSALATGLLVCALATAASAKDGVLRIGTEGDAPKFSMADPSGDVTGFDADIAKDICAELKVKCEFVVQTFSSLVPSMDSDRFDVIISGLSITDERAKKIDYSIPYATTPQYFVVAKDSPLAKLKTLAEVEKALGGKSVGVVTGTTYAKFVQKNIPSADLKTYDATTQQLADLSSGRIDAAYGDSPTWMDFLSTPDGANFTKIDVKVMAMDDPDTLGKGMGVGMRKGNTELKAKVDAAVCKMVNDGKVKEASMTWFQDDYTIPCKK